MALMPWPPPDKLGKEEVKGKFRLVGVANVTTSIGIYSTYIYEMLEPGYPYFTYFDMETDLLVKAHSTGEVKYRNTTVIIISINIK